MAAADSSPLELHAGGQTFQALDRIAVGSFTTLYRCRSTAHPKAPEMILKVARDARTNPLLVNEAQVLRNLRERDTRGEFAPFLPKIEASFELPESPARRANVLRMDEAIRSSDDLYTLAEVRAHYSQGLDARDMAWIWRRLLSVLGFVHSQRIVHGAVLPMHVLIEPNEHKLLLIDWCGATSAAGRTDDRQATVFAGGYHDWYKAQHALRGAPSPGVDVGLGARSMIELLGGDPIHATFPASIDAGIQRHLMRCVRSGSSACQDAWKLLEDFDRLIEVLWGPRVFRKLEMPPRA